jgi:subtilisin-like proprotein convertase family protein
MTCTSTIARGFAIALVTMVVSFVAAGQAVAATFSNTNPITINDGADECPDGEPATTPAPASPYPSPIVVSGLGTMSDVNVTLTGLTHTFPDDVDVLLVGPAGQSTLLMADTGDGNANAVSGVDLTFDDAAGDSLPDEGQIVSGTYKPTLGTANFGCAVPTSFPTPAPAGPYGPPSLAVFNGTNPNGSWSLYVIDDSALDTGSISGGWSLDISAPPLAVTLSSFTASRSHGRVVLRWRTGTEANELGFNVYRQQGARRVRLNRRVLPALGSIAGASYSFVDRHAPRHRVVRYWLQDVSTTGARTLHGPVRVPAA